MEHDLLKILKELEACDKGLERVESDAPIMSTAGIVYDVTHVRTILLGAMIRLDTVIFDEGIAR